MWIYWIMVLDLTQPKTIYKGLQEIFFFFFYMLEICIYFLKEKMTSNFFEPFKMKMSICQFLDILNSKKKNSILMSRH